MLIEYFLLLTCRWLVKQLIFSSLNSFVIPVKFASTSFTKLTYRHLLVAIIVSAVKQITKYVQNTDTLMV